MSRYLIDPIDPNHEMAVGWDPPLNTFFLHVIDITKDEDDETYDVKWVGTSPHEIHDVDDIVEKANKYGNLSDEVQYKLYRDANE